MSKLIHNLRQKSEHERKVFAFIAVSIITGFIFLIWSGSLISRFSSEGRAYNETKRLTKVRESQNASSILTRTKDSFGGLSNLIGSINKPIVYEQSDDDVLNNKSDVYNNPKDSELKGDEISTSTIYLLEEENATEYILETSKKPEIKPDNL